MGIDIKYIEEFARLFKGLDRAKGRYVLTSNPSQLVVGDKAKGKATTITEVVTLDDYALHLTGQISLGIVPVRDDSTCVFGAIDIDQYAGLDHAALVKIIQDNNIPAIVCRSKSGGAHVYTFGKEPGIQAQKLVQYLRKLRTQLGIDPRKAREIFPKQTKHSGGIGNWINLPYFGDTRCAVKADGTDMTLEEFLAAVQKLDASDIEKGADEGTIILNELPPCLEALVSQGIPSGMRNEALFNFTVFAAKKYQLDRPNTIKMLESVNRKVCQPPVQTREMATTLDSVLKHEYNYRCDQSPIVDVCDKVRCSMRPYGPSASMRPSNIPAIEKIEIRGDENDETKYYVKLATLPNMVVCDSRALLDYNLFRRHVMDKAHILLPPVKPKEWDAYITARFSALCETVRVARERSRKGVLDMMLEDWIKTHGASDPLRFDLGNPYFESGQVFISFVAFCRKAKQLTLGKLDYTAIAAYLEDNGWEKTDKTIGERIYEGVWTRGIDAHFTPSQGGVVVVHDGQPAGTPPDSGLVETRESALEDVDWSKYRPDTN